MSATNVPNLLDMAGPGEVTTVPDAVILAGANTLLAYPVSQRHMPARALTPLTQTGVRSSDGEIAPGGTDVFRHRWTYPLALAEVDSPLDHRAGCVVYGGVAGPQFGHLLTQSLGRLWAAPPDVPIVFLAANPGFTQLPAYFVTLLRLLGVNNPVEVLPNSCRVETLILARDYGNLERRPPITPIFAQWLAQRRPDVALDPDLSLYVSRSRLGQTLGQYLQETALEQALRDQGYVIVYPEQMSLQAQVDLYLRAKRLIFADGSAVHLWSLFAHVDQMAAVICRRAPHTKMVAWFAGLPQADAQFFDSRLAEFSGKARGANKSVVLLDMDQIWRRLRRRSFHATRRVYFPPRAAVMEWLGAVQGGADIFANPPFDIDPTTRALLEALPNIRLVQ